MRRFCFTATRTLVIVINLLVTALAGLFIYVSFNTFNQDFELDSMSDARPRLLHIYVSLLCAGLGLIVALLSFLGLLGALRKSKSILTVYAAMSFFMVAILVVFVAMTYSIPSSPSPSYQEVDKSFVNSTIIVYNYVDSSDMKTKVIDNIQRSFSCCGLNSPDDWTEYSLQKIPRSCCSQPVESSLPVFKYCAESDFKIGCWKALLDYLHTNLPLVRRVLYFFIAFGLTCTAAAIFIIFTLRKSLDVV